MNTRKDHIVNSLAEVEMSDFKIPVIAVYQCPDDYPDKYIARVFDLDKPTDMILAKDTLEEITEDIKSLKHHHCTFMPRGAEDVQALVGVWM